MWLSHNQTLQGDPRKLGIQQVTKDEPCPPPPDGPVLNAEQALTPNSSCPDDAAPKALSGLNLKRRTCLLVPPCFAIAVLCYPTVNTSGLSIHPDLGAVM